MTQKKSIGKCWASFLLVGIGLLVLFFVSINLGSIRLTVPQLLRGLFVESDRDVASVYDLRFPRILISMMGVAALAGVGATGPIGHLIVGFCSGQSLLLSG